MNKTHISSAVSFSHIVKPIRVARKPTIALNWIVGITLAVAGCLSATAAVIPSDTSHVKSLNGTWRFKLEQRGDKKASDAPGMRPEPRPESVAREPFHLPDYKEDNTWTNLAVPGNWEMAGLSPATYNQPDNASGFYRLWFEVPKAWKGRLVQLNFDGVQNGAEFWLNGQPVAVDDPSWRRTNYHEGGWTAFQVDLTPAVKFGEKNLLAVRVTKNTRSADLDTGDYFFLGGIHRAVTLFSVPKTHLADVTVQTRLLAGNRAEVKVQADVTGADGDSISMRLDGVAGKTSARIESGRAVLTQIVEQPKLWSAEFPNLYDLKLELKDGRQKTLEAVSKRIGIREVSITNSVLLVNGVPVKLAGVCRHDVSPTEGTAVGPDLWRKDIMLMKAANINAIRTSHYPYGAGFYELCDELGMYVVDELPYCWCPTDNPWMQPAFDQRARETIRRDKNHPSIIIWAVGNENFKEYRNLQAVADLVKQLDSTRPRLVSCFDGGKCNTELSDLHYSRPDRIMGTIPRARETGRPQIFLENPNTWDIRLAADPGAWERWGPVLQRVWDVCVTNDVVPGTFLWEWQDRAVADKSSTKHYVYFPDTGIQLLKIKGLVDGFRNPRPWLYEVKMVYSPIQIGAAFTATSGRVSFPVDNRYSFTDLSHLKLSWKLERAGKKIAAGNTRARLSPLTKGQVELSLPDGALSKADALQVEFIHPDGNQVVAHRFVMTETSAQPQVVATLPAGQPLPQFNLVTRNTERDSKTWRKIERFPARLNNVVLNPAGATTLAELKELKADIVDAANGKVLGSIQARHSNGEFSYKMEWTGAKAEVQELGWAFSLPKECDRFSWDRASRWTVYPAKHTSRATGTATPDTMNVPVTRMDRVDAFDFNGTKYDCNWASLTTPAGKGLRVEFDAKQRFHCRGGAAEGGRGYVLFVNQQVSPPHDLSRPVVQDLYLALNPGDTIEGRFRVSSGQITASR